MTVQDLVIVLNGFCTHGHGRLAEKNLVAAGHPFKVYAGAAAEIKHPSRFEQPQQLILYLLPDKAVRIVSKQHPVIIAGYFIVI